MCDPGAVQARSPSWRTSAREVIDVIEAQGDVVRRVVCSVLRVRIYRGGRTQVRKRRADLDAAPCALDVAATFMAEEVSGAGWGREGGS